METEAEKGEIGMETAEEQKSYLGLPLESLAITWVRVRRLLLLYLASSILTFSTVPVLSRLSEPARSTRF